MPTLYFLWGIACNMKNAAIIERKKYLDLDIEPFFFDDGCQVATLFLRINNHAQNSTCEQCPFPKCIDELSTEDRKIINRAQDLKKLYNFYDNGLSIVTISQQLHMTISLAHNYIYNRQRIQDLLNRWGIEIKSNQLALL